MTTEDYARELKSKRYPYLLEVSPVNIITDGTRNDQIDIGLGELKSFSTAGDIHGIKSVLFSFDGGILRVHFPKSKKFKEDYLKIAMNMTHTIYANIDPDAIDDEELKKISELKEFEEVYSDAIENMGLVDDEDAPRTQKVSKKIKKVFK